MDVTVIGSLNVDVFFGCETIPRPGETLLCDDYRLGAGGKGLNQAVAAARAGAETAIIGSVGCDHHADFVVEALVAEGVDIHRLARSSTQRTGLAHIAVDRNGENSILVATGANGAIYPIDSSDFGRVILVQLEIALEVAREALEAAKRLDRITVLNAAPALDGALDLAPLCDVIVVNEHEFAALTGVQIDLVDHAANEQAASRIINLSTQSVVVTLGSKGVRVLGPDGTRIVPARMVQPVDTTGAGDCFCGVLAASFAKGMHILEAVVRANFAASLAVERPGSASAMPFAHEIEQAAEI